MTKYLLIALLFVVNVDAALQGAIRHNYDTTGTNTISSAVTINLLTNINAGSIVVSNLQPNMIVFTDANNRLTNGVVDQTNFYTTNVFSENIYVSNLFATNIFNTTLITSNIFTTNLFATNISVYNVLVTNNLNAFVIYVSNLFATNIYATYINTTNLYTSNLFATNIYAENIYTSNLFATNVFTTNLYASNIFATNISVYTLNAYDLVVTNSLTVNGINALYRNYGAACSDLTTALTTGTNKGIIRLPHAMTLTGVRASLLTAQTSGSIFTVDINENGTSVLSTKITIDNTEKTSVTAATQPVISDSSLASDSEIEIDIDQVGDGTAIGLQVWIIGVHTP